MWSVAMEMKTVQVGGLIGDDGEAIDSNKVKRLASTTNDQRYAVQTPCGHCDCDVNDVECVYDNDNCVSVWMT
nr:hypothetical protein Itr_chr09CG04990 [Ipomoea trifida]